MKFCFVGTALKFHVGAMPRLEQLQFGVNAGHGSFGVHGVPFEHIRTKDAIADLDLGLDSLLSLEIVTANVNCLGATAAEVEEVEAVVRGQMEGHPNRPTIRLNRVYETCMLPDEDPEAQVRHYMRVISMDCAGASLCEVDKVEAALRHAADVHPGHPTIELIKINTEADPKDKEAYRNGGTAMSAVSGRKPPQSPTSHDVVPKWCTIIASSHQRTARWPAAVPWDAGDNTGPMPAKLDDPFSS
ncbi:hypothetical protein HU200_001390 [Digitaria exilis]|uniref:Disease resistance R13L4/SHOC-2-like LRR domain-containing protein n=1 Tax=Digitaria exilis TaxID=1010633 RepID=A0A835G0H6_9POAL|nr:hypothetical protein HU200_001390 [Digitaria exilis]